jgi:hypothetical protein
MDGFVVVVAAIVVDGMEGAVVVDETPRAGVGSCVLDPEPAAPSNHDGAQIAQTTRATSRLNRECRMPGICARRKCRSQPRARPVLPRIITVTSFPMVTDFGPSVAPQYHRQG